MADKKEEKTPQKPKVKVKKVFDVVEKIEAIEKSKMPKAQKAEYIASLKAEKKVVGVPFSVYARLKSVPAHLHGAMKAFTKRKDATIKEWEEIFKKF